jgi:3-hydroxyanthranilate 3,4-dioxygenase
MMLKVVDDSQFRNIIVREGDMFLLPGNTPHKPIRFANTVGIVLEQRRPADSLDIICWYCQSCGEVVHEASFYCTDIGSQIKAATENFMSSTENRHCSKCGELADSLPKSGSIVDPNLA